ncbi:peptidylprolyl isomerase [Malassezia japonica]|uniref:peptidylprolyl isomerase n=1 Tax=Malassezia japonica TaxID=223818 RepID=A0AAF0F9L0_9BASI|nr:peptidylprolyl isomerase [Malassezia japonica]WFD40837.1 peptidylprolyl isomerase [Malassezia japonica]
MASGEAVVGTEHAEERVDERTEEQILQEEEEKAKHEAEMAEEAAKEEERRKNNASAAALTLEIVGDLPHADVKPPENILFVCKLNPVTRSDDLELIFSRFGKICSCEVIRDKKTGDSLQYAFIEFEEREAAEKAYSKMQNVLIDDRRIWVDFSQSVSKLHSVWVKGPVTSAVTSAVTTDGHTATTAIVMTVGRVNLMIGTAIVMTGHDRIVTMTDIAPIAPFGPLRI